MLGDGGGVEEFWFFFWFVLCRLGFFKFRRDIGIWGFRRFLLWVWVILLDFKLFFGYSNDKNFKGFLLGLEMKI